MRTNRLHLAVSCARPLPVLLALCIAAMLAGCEVPPAEQEGEQQSAVSGTASTPAPQPVASATPGTEFVKQAMQRIYGSDYDAGNKCWRHAVESGGEDGETTYCMRPGEAHAVEGGVVYLSAHNISDPDADQPQYLYGMQDPGVFGAFKLQANQDGGLKDVLASSPAMTYGTAGSCGCEDAEFKKVGPASYAWIFTSGGTWQGQTVSAYSIVTDRSGEFRNVASIPHTVEGKQGVVYELKVDDRGSGEMYPLAVTETRDGKKVREQQVAFDAVKGQYALE